MADPTVEVILKDLTGLSKVAGYAALPSTGGTCEAVIDYSDPTDLLDSERASVIVVYEDRSPVVVSPTHAVEEGSSEVVRGVPLQGGALVVGCSDGSVNARITLADSGTEAIAERERQASEEASKPPGWLASLERAIKSASTAAIVLGVLGLVLYVGTKAEVIGKAAKAARKAV